MKGQHYQRIQPDLAADLIFESWKPQLIAYDDGADSCCCSKVISYCLNRICSIWSEIIHCHLCSSADLENDIRAIHQKNISIQEFYSTMTDLWDQLALTELTELKACGALIDCRK